MLTLLYLLNTPIIGDSVNYNIKYGYFKHIPIY